MFVGDPAQLPPVGQTLSPAFSRDYLQKTFLLMCTGFELTEVIRQKAGGAILNPGNLFGSGSYRLEGVQYVPSVLLG